MYYLCGFILINTTYVLICIGMEFDFDVGCCKWYCIQFNNLNYCGK